MNGLVPILSVALLFSATFKKKVEMLCRDILTDPIRAVVGELGEVSAKCWSKKGPVEGGGGGKHNKKKRGGGSVPQGG